LNNEGVVATGILEAFEDIERVAIDEELTRVTSCRAVLDVPEPDAIFPLAEFSLRFVLLRDA